VAKSPEGLAAAWVGDSKFGLPEGLGDCGRAAARTAVAQLSCTSVLHVCSRIAGSRPCRVRTTPTRPAWRGAGTVGDQEAGCRVRPSGRHGGVNASQPGHSRRGGSTPAMRAEAERGLAALCPRRHRRNVAGDQDGMAVTPAVGVGQVVTSPSRSWPESATTARKPPNSRHVSDLTCQSHLGRLSAVGDPPAPPPS
jgi:hypothetical protein